MTKPPSLRTLTRELRELHEAWSHPDVGGEYVCMARCLGAGWVVEPVSSAESCKLPMFGREYIPGDGKPLRSAHSERLRWL